MSFEGWQALTPAACAVPTYSVPVREGRRDRGVQGGRFLAIMAVSRSDFVGEVLKTPS